MPQSHLPKTAKFFEPNTGHKDFSVVADVRLKNGRVVTVQGYGKTKEEAEKDWEAVAKKVMLYDCA